MKTQEVYSCRFCGNPVDANGVAIDVDKSCEKCAPFESRDDVTFDEADDEESEFDEFDMEDFT